MGIEQALGHARAFVRKDTDFNVFGKFFPDQRLKRGPVVRKLNADDEQFWALVAQNASKCDDKWQRSGAARTAKGVHMHAHILGIMETCRLGQRAIEQHACRS